MYLFDNQKYYREYYVNEGHSSPVHEQTENKLREHPYDDAHGAGCC